MRPEFPFKVAGILITASVISGGPGFPFLSPVLFKYFTSAACEIDNVLAEITKEDVVDWNTLKGIENVTMCRTCQCIARLK